jgi:hypothetical protein
VKGKNRRKMKDNLRIIHKKSQTYNKYYSEFIQVSNVCNATATGAGAGWFIRLASSLLGPLLS